jgi:hypothetical protein
MRSRRRLQGWLPRDREEGVWVEHNLERPVGQTAAVVADAAHIVEEGIVLLKTRVTAAAAADPTE